LLRAWLVFFAPVKRAVGSLFLGRSLERVHSVMKKHCGSAIALLVLVSTITIQVLRASTTARNNVPPHDNLPDYYLELRDASVSSALLMVSGAGGRSATAMGGYRMGRTTVTIAARSLDETLRRLRAVAPVPIQQEDRGDRVWFQVDLSQEVQYRYSARREHLEAQYNALSRLKSERLNHPERFAPVSEDTLYLRTAGIMLRPRRMAIIEYGTPPFVEQGFGLLEGHSLGEAGANLVIYRITRAGVSLRSQNGRRRLFAPFRFSTVREKKEQR
jgi:hypothetical protein